MNRRIELKGKRFGRLAVIGFSRINKGGNACWLCKCDCGNEVVVIGDNLRYGQTKSCGCLKKELNENRTLLEGEAARNIVIREYKANAKKRNHEQALTDEQIIELHKGNCHYCGAPPSNIRFQKYCNGSYIYSGIDRVNSEKGYTVDNVVPCCADCNYAKRALSSDDFLDLIKRIHSHLNLDA